MGFLPSLAKQGQWVRRVKRRRRALPGDPHPITWGGFGYVPGPVIALLYCGFWVATWAHGHFPQDLRVEWHRGD